MSEKYPRTLHLPWSPGGTDDDKRMSEASALRLIFGDRDLKPIVITEKCDGSNLCMTQDNVFARSHSGSAQHPSFAVAKARHAELRHQIPSGYSVFMEYCYAVHSVKYTSLPDYFLVFGIRNDATNVWGSWDEVEAMARELKLPTTPVLYRGKVPATKFRELTYDLAEDPSAYGPTREGLVVRTPFSFSEDTFRLNVAKWVRKDHVQTDDHWKNQKIVPQGIMKRPF